MSASQSTKRENAFWVTIGTETRVYLPKRILEYTGLKKGDQIQLKIAKTRRWRPKKYK